mgnify:CR=1 FL=1
MAVVLSIISKFDDRGVRRAQASLARLGSRARGFAGSMSADMVRAGAALDVVGAKAQRVGRQMSLYVSLPVAAAGAASVKLAADFDAALSKVGSLVGASEEQLAAYRASVLEMGRKLPQAPKELAEALFFITSAGLQGEQALQVLEASAKAAAAGLGDTKTVADAATSALNAYGAENLSASAATDVLVASVREGKMEPAELAGALGKVIPVASSMGVSFAQVGAAIAGMTRTGMNAAEASTALRAMLAQLLKPTKQTSDGLRSVGLSVEQVQESLRGKGLFATLQLLNDRFGANAQKAAEVFGNIRGLTGVLSLVGPNATKNALIFQRLAEASGDTAEAFERAKAADPTLRFNIMKSSLQAAGIQLGESLLPAVLQAAAALTELADRFGKLSSKTQGTVVKLALAAAAMGPLLRIVGSFARVAGGALKVAGNLGIAFGKNARSAPLYARAIAASVKALGSLAKATAQATVALARQGAAMVVSAAKTVANTAATLASRAAMLAVSVATKAWAAAQWVLNAALSANPIGLVVVAIAGLATALVLAWKRSETFRRIVIGAWEAIKKATRAVFGWIAGFFRRWGPLIARILIGPLGNLVLYIVRHWEQVRSGAVRAFGAVVAFARSLPGRIRRAVGSLGKTLYDAGADLLRGLWDGMRSMAGWLRDRLTGFFSDLVPSWARQALGISSPSRVFAAIGRDIAAGLSLGLDRGRDEVRAALLNLVGTPSGSGRLAVALAGTPTAARAPIREAVVRETPPPLVQVYLDSEPIAARVEVRQAQRLRRAARTGGVGRA